MVRAHSARPAWAALQRRNAVRSRPHQVSMAACVIGPAGRSDGARQGVVKLGGGNGRALMSTLSEPLHAVSAKALTISIWIFIRLSFQFLDQPVLFVLKCEPVRLFA